VNGLLVDDEEVDTLVEAFAPLQLQGAAAQKGDGALFAAEGQSGFQRIVVQQQVHVPVAEAFLDAQLVDGLVSSVGRAPLLSGCHQRPVDEHSVLARIAILSAVELLTYVLCVSAKISNGRNLAEVTDVSISPTKETHRACMRGRRRRSAGGWRSGTARC